MSILLAADKEEKLLKSGMQRDCTHWNSYVQEMHTMIIPQVHFLLQMHLDCRISKEGANTHKQDERSRTKFDRSIHHYTRYGMRLPLFI